MTTFKTGDRVKIKPVATVQNIDFHNREGIVSRVLDIRTAMWNIGVDLPTGIAYFDESELEKVGKNVYARQAEEQMGEKQESLTEGVVEAAAALSLLREAQDSRLDMAIDYLESRASIYHQMFHTMEEAGDDQGQLIYALVHDETRVAIRLLEQHKEEEGVFDAE